MLRLLCAMTMVMTVAASQAFAIDRLSPEEFRALAEGKSLQFESRGAPYGAEQYLPGDRVIWRYADGACVDGVWRARGMDLCFRYDYAPDVEQCWGFFEDDFGRYAQRVGEDGAVLGSVKLRVSRMTDAPLACKGPNLGV